MFYRIKQFFQTFVAKLEKKDYDFINFYLNSKEKELFYKLNKADQYHSLKVARQVIDRSVKEGCYDILLVKAALLHDVGKINSGLNVLTKSIMVILDRMFSRQLRKVKKIKFIKYYYDHPKIAVQYLYPTDEYLLFLIENHHNYNINDKKLKLLQECDCKN
ncbi:HD domain-containing protein [Caloramator fervidus]|uniref:HD domain-containing protein n=1 Tax=Caloramator fervidus TaxID=29344 RepID=A0A1H5XFB0_9CLOT|nr:HD domain-containing protein [Caloramator fervidus]SEG10432.1 HD domain-containing protein [Caloramator fervidus]